MTREYATRTLIRRWMLSALQDGECIDPTTGGANLTELAEGAAHAVGHDEWLDDPDHWIWDEAIQAAEALGMLV